jgi:hypothetical protein
MIWKRMMITSNEKEDVERKKRRNVEDAVDKVLRGKLSLPDHEMRGKVVRGLALLSLKRIRFWLKRARLGRVCSPKPQVFGIREKKRL